MTTRARLLLFTIALLLSATVLAGVIGYRVGDSTLHTIFSGQLTQSRLGRAYALQKDFENLGNTLLIASEMSRTREALKGFRKSEPETLAWIRKNAHPQEWQSQIEAHYKAAPASALRAAIEKLPLESQYLQSQFIKKAQHEDLPLRGIVTIAPPSNLEYFRIHEIIHPLYMDYADRFGLADILLITPEGRIIYSLQKRLNLQTNLKAGIFKDSRLSEAYVWSLTAAPRSFKFFDFAPASSFQPTSVAYFISPIFDKAQFLGTIAFQISADHIDNILSDNHQWKKLGLQKSGEILALGRDGILRNNTRSFYERPERFLKDYKKHGASSEVLQQLETSKSAAFILKLPLDKVQKYFNSEELIESGPDYLGTESLASIGPVHLPGGGDWVLVAKMDHSEITAPLSRYLLFFVLGLIVLLTAVTFTAMRVSKRLNKPLQLLETALEKIKNHEWPLEIDHKAHDEYVQIFQDLNQVAAELQEKTESSEILKNLFHSLKELLILVDLEFDENSGAKRWTIKGVNSAATEMIGIPSHTMMNSDLKLWIETDFETIFSLLKEDGPGTGTQEGVLKKISAGRVPLALSFSKLNSSEKNHRNFVLIATDISRQKEIERALKVQEGLLKESQAMSKTGSFLWTISSGNAVWSDQLFEILGLDPKTTRPSVDLFRSLILHEDLSLLNTAYIDAQKSSQPIKVDLRIRRADTHDLIWLRLAGRLEYDEYGKPISVSGIIQDVTDLKQAEMGLILAKNEALKSSQAKSEFLAHMSHEIRTPMNAIMGMADLLRETKLSEEQEYYVSIFCKAGEVLMALINDILDLSKIEAGEVSIENIPFDLSKLMEDIRDMMRPKALEKGIEYSYEVGKGINSSLMGDPTKLRQVLINLVGNSIKFTERGQIRVTVTKHPTKKDNLIISVNDSGVGIPSNKQHLIFQKFSQADTSITRRYGGTGLGLAISKSLVELMGGQIWFKSREGLGTTFFIALPMREQIYNVATMKPVAMKKPELDFITTKAPPDPNRKVRILLADDTEDNRILFRHYLKGGPYEIIEAENGLQALDKIKSNEFDIVFMDVQMPEMDGYAATNQVRAWEENVKHPHIPIIALTAHALSDDKEKSLKAGCDDHITKPFKKDTLLNVINRYLN